MYDATIGRWLSRDPIGFNAGDANLYRYVGNNATNLTDPSGLEGIKPEGKLVGKPVDRTAKLKDNTIMIGGQKAVITAALETYEKDGKKTTHVRVEVKLVGPGTAAGRAALKKANWVRTSRRTSSNPKLPDLGPDLSQYTVTVTDKKNVQREIMRLYGVTYTDSGTDYSPFANSGVSTYERLPDSLTIWDSPTGYPDAIFPKEVAMYADNLIIDGKAAYTVNWYREWKYDPEAKVSERVKEVAFDVIAGGRVKEYKPSGKKLVLGFTLKGKDQVPIEVDNPITGPYPHDK